MNEPAPKLHVGLMLLSLLIAIAMWTVKYPGASPAPAWRRVDVPLHIGSLSSDLIVTKPADSIPILFKGTLDELHRLDPTRAIAYAQMQDATPGTRSYQVVVLSNYTDPQLMQKYIVGQPEAMLTVEQLMTRKVEVTVETSGKLPDPTIALMDTVIDPPQVVIKGPKSQIEKVTHVIARLELDSVDVNARKSYFRAVRAATTDRSLPTEVSFEPMAVKLTPLLSSSAQSKPAFVVPVITGTVGTGFQAASWDVAPSQVILSGPPTALAKMTKVYTDPVDVTGITKSKVALVNLRIPPGMTIAGPKRVRVRIQIVPQGTGSRAAIQLPMSPAHAQ